MCVCARACVCTRACARRLDRGGLGPQQRPLLVLLVLQRHALARRVELEAEAMESGGLSGG
eukprot:scaffold98514_cov75-Phaeocystis_antarctica.AAC.1